MLWDIGFGLCLSCKKNSKFCDLETPHSDLEKSVWELSSPLNSLAGSFSSWDALLLSGKLAADVRELCKCLTWGQVLKKLCPLLAKLPKLFGVSGGKK